jgi:hypothetical protein
VSKLCRQRCGLTLFKGHDSLGQIPGLPHKYCPPLMPLRDLRTLKSRSSMIKWEEVGRSHLT